LNSRLAAAVKTLLLLIFLGSALQSGADSNINPNHALAWGANIGWTNWRPDQANGAQIGEYICSGYVYSANAGWINLGNGRPSNGVQYQNKSAADFGVNHDQLGNLRGLAYGANIGWINFETNGSPRLDLQTGNLSGFVYGANVGWISLSDSAFFLQADSISAGMDTDTDGIPDSWEFLHSQSLSIFTRESDRDNDGFADFQEYLADTDPNDPNDNLRILQFSRSPDGGMSLLTWLTRPTRQYVIQDRLQFNPNTIWMNSVAGPITGNGGALSATITNRPGAAQQFFRIQAIRPLAP
jgi:hypothetical protein